MSTKTQSELSKFFGPVVATGAERICVRNLNNEFSCFKISKKIHSKETRREIKYFKFLKKRGISSSFIPSFISDFETKDEVIIEQELIADHHLSLSFVCRHRSPFHSFFCFLQPTKS